MLGFVGEQGSKQECSCPPGWNPVNKNLFPSPLIAGSCVEVSRGRALVWSVHCPAVCISILSCCSDGRTCRGRTFHGNFCMMDIYVHRYIF